MRIVAVIQARMSSSRLPGKVLMPLGRQPVLQRVIRRVQETGTFAEVVVATTVRPIDDPLADAANGWGARALRGDENDVLGRYGMAAAESQADAIMRVTADCPLIDPDVMKVMVERFLSKPVAGESEVDFVTNSRIRTFPRGLDAELFTREALDIMLSEAGSASDREHVTPFLYRHPERFNIIDHIADEDHSELRLTLDTTEDYELLTRIHDAAPDPDTLRLNGVLDLLAAHPEWHQINANVEQKKV